MWISKTDESEKKHISLFQRNIFTKIQSRQTYKERLPKILPSLYGQWWKSNESARGGNQKTAQEGATFQMSSWAIQEISNALFTTETGETFSVSMSIVYKETPTCKVLRTSRTEDLESRRITATDT